MKDRSGGGSFLKKMFWLIRLRWVAITGVMATIIISTRVFHIKLPVAQLFSIGVFLAFYNTVFYFLGKYFLRKKHRDRERVAEVLSTIQIALDLTCLAVLIHFSGGVENPFRYYFVFHIIVASILLSRRNVILQTVYAISLYTAIVALEYFKIIPHYGLEIFMREEAYDQPLYILSILFVFITTLCISAYMATSVSSQLRKSERSLRNANKLLNEQDRIKSEYVLQVTHDIKGHLAAIQGCIEPVTEGIVGSLSEKQMFLLGKAGRRIGKLLFFVKALLEITRIKLKKELKMDMFRIRDVMESVVSVVGFNAKEKDIDLAVNIDKDIGEMRGVRMYIEEAVQNILANAIKYTPRDGQIRVDVKNAGDSVSICIKDNGIGIPKEDLENIFEEFHRASNAQKVERDGTGLGLSIAKHIVDRHRGEIWADSELGKGSVFKILLPKCPEEK